MRRACDSPSPARGGTDCQGDKDSEGYQYQDYSCNEQHCPGFVCNVYYDDLLYTNIIASAILECVLSSSLLIYNNNNNNK